MTLSASALPVLKRLTASVNKPFCVRRRLGRNSGWSMVFGSGRPLVRNVVTFVDDYSSALFNTICIGSAWPKAHQDKAFTGRQSEIHSSVKMDAEVGAHFEVGSNIACIHHGRAKAISVVGRFQAGNCRTWCLTRTVKCLVSGGEAEIQRSGSVPENPRRIAQSASLLLFSP